MRVNEAMLRKARDAEIPSDLHGEFDSAVKSVEGRHVSGMVLRTSEEVQSAMEGTKVHSFRHNLGQRIFKLLHGGKE